MNKTVQIPAELWEEIVALVADVWLATSTMDNFYNEGGNITPTGKIVLQRWLQAGQRNTEVLKGIMAVEEEVINAKLDNQKTIQNNEGEGRS